MHLTEVSNNMQTQRQMYPENLKEKSHVFRVSMRRDQNKAEFSKKRSRLIRAVLSED